MRHFLFNKTLGLFLFSGLLILVGCAAVQHQPGTALPDAGATGIAVERIHPSAGGQMLDLRYRVTDPEKAKLSFKRGAQIYLIAQSTGEKLPVPDMPKVGKLLQRPDQGESGRIYWVFFSNIGAVVKTGDRVTLVIDELQIRDIIVQ